MLGVTPTQSSSSVTRGANGTSSTPQRQRSSPGHPSSPSQKLQHMIQSMTKQVANRSPTPIEPIDENDEISSVSSADTLHQMVDVSQQLLHISRDTLAMVVDLPRGQASTTDTLSKVEEHLSRIKRRTGFMEQSIEKLAYSNGAVKHCVEAILNRARKPQKLDTLRVTSTMIWIDKALKGARSIVELAHGDTYVISQFDKIGHYARQFRYGFYDQVEYPRQYELIRDQMDIYAAGYPSDALVTTQEAIWEETYCRPSGYPTVHHQCQCIQEMLRDEDCHGDPIACAARRYSQNLLLEIRIQLHTFPLNDIKLVKVEDINIF
ncbi:hypothetical protein CAEBREN_22996 [Caenorhabditis brenneri]|uniref:Uncharacterized protein n=1 Tax=Caenorhabditis brenneri TaxID=135651 RepID=G0P583_CAEBE|nr:hypothetical protein CAEBREN_22996 [Caenorhabditis brenneri]